MDIPSYWIAEVYKNLTDRDNDKEFQIESNTCKIVGVKNTYDGFYDWSKSGPKFKIYVLTSVDPTKFEEVKKEP